MGQDRRQFRMVALEGGRGGRGHRACLLNSVTQFRVEVVGVRWGEKQEGKGRVERRGNLREGSGVEGRSIK